MCRPASSVKRSIPRPWMLTPLRRSTRRKRNAGRRSPRRLPHRSKPAVPSHSYMSLRAYGAGALDDGAADLARCFHKLLQFCARQRIKFQLGCFDLGQKVGVLERRVECSSQHLKSIGRHIGRRDDSAADRAAAGVEAQHVLVLLRLAKLDDSWNGGKLRAALERKLHENADQAAVEPVALCSLEGVERTRH